MEKVFIDSDVIIDYLRGYLLRIKDLFVKIEQGKVRGYISWINVVELYSGADSSEKEEILKKLLELFDIVEENQKSAKLAGQIKRENKLEISDAIIASLVLTSDLKLMTFNIKDFKKVKKIEFYKLPDEKN